MRKEKGVTLITLVVYIIILTIIIGILSMISQMFFSNINYITERGKYISEFNKFNMYFIEDVKNNKDIIEIKEDGSQVIFEDGTIYTFSNNGIYRNKVKICKDILKCYFTKLQTNPEETGGITKNLVTVNMIINGSKNYETENEYVLKYW